MLTEAQVRQAITDAGIEVDADAIPAADLLSEHGIDSLDLFNLILEVQGITDREVPDEDVAKLTTINAFVAYFANDA